MQRATVLPGRPGVAAQHARLSPLEIRSLRMGLALVWHRRASFLALGQSFPPLQHVGAFQVADLVGDTLREVANKSQGLDVVGMPIAADHLGADGVGTTSRWQLRAFHLRIGVGIGAHRSADLPHGHHRLQPLSRFLVAQGFSSQPATLKPKVMASPWMAWERPTITVSLCGPGQLTQSRPNRQVSWRRLEPRPSKLQGQASVERIGRLWSCDVM